ncbi:MAG TPA: heme biosynthesis HemY N-terminal domain-containing protein [Acidiphilium sp.]|uniref:heme biosynthesis HemY N-terminal domain-containing protein n=1 Tax=unclassified Acidiphilium TaxID=2617493 RepID=UPI000BC4E782|nr:MULTISPECIES: heme biosynthesis HemY N-terminal domain-containing protein [unclassified Acidiphilium]OYV57186.1 MAG: heme biosynthesis protein HemY [Acidiphilium sp. 20-67-58]OYV85117.1 MAG: heme biosynthesis protein HemY [Acidiphilium sp. 21-68-69]HQT60594.1 heme biosynthesis HemY N-terminal domain-containing protein [Acidiphilium sp.]HQU11245.1 heme biosynthesis HemY N-terminal domain-containing protein [Acidiphilium sp.]
MLRAFRFGLVAIVLLGVAWYLASLQGHVTVEIGSYAASASTPVAILLLVFLVAVAIVALGLLRGALGLPRRVAAKRSRARRDAADAASLRALAALAAGDIGAASGHARTARRHAPDAPLPLYVSAETARQSGDATTAETLFADLAKHGDAGFLGWRGLLTARPLPQDDEDGLALAAERARKAAASYPRSGWLREQRVRIALGQGRFGEAARLATDAPARAALAIMASREAGGEPLAIDWAREAVRAAPELPEAYMALYQARAKAGQTWRAKRVLKRGWRLAPHPDLGEAWLAEISAPLERAAAAARLAAVNPGHPESEALLARTARAARLTGEAERHERQSGGKGAWICKSCETEHEAWQPTCRKCAAIGSLGWVRHGTAAPTPPLLPAPQPAG